LAEIRETYRPLGRIVAILYFIVNELSTIEPMYQFSLERYKDLFSNTIEVATKSSSDNTSEKIEKIDEYHRKNVFQTYSTSLFSRDRLLLALSMSIAIKKFEGDFDQDEYDFFLRGGLIIDKENFPKNPAPGWLNEKSWEDIVDLDRKLPNFNGI